MENDKNDKTHWLQSPNKNYLGHWDLPHNKDLILTIKSAGWESVEDPVSKKTESKRVVRFVEKSIKPWICNQTNAQSIIDSTGIKYMDDSKGLKISLYISSTRVKGENVDCIRVRKTKVKLPELIPGSDKWDGAKKAIDSGNYTLEQVKIKYSLSPENEKLLCLK